ncbi:TRAP-type C4-dicarboxylate transport system, small permease component [Lutimaribacter pacificus]|uniref:TRAP transporter small permease protein n=1 Tax=Lutimaribacter pacificus TaxID=391948 RepID=A0A1H0ENU1_9RHOB|nr:TRAP transporter small permease [Lutimaribacter pacificus]SDN83973.1 TRAP-type C4-dicarboxylate transport system, small permease component [Lutimaribacter pacificus]SHK50794.1 TRAP-type C4-dicarboxylate transport system, small permease component [Lutimaribacter pacificus]
MVEPHSRAFTLFSKAVEGVNALFTAIACLLVAAIGIIVVAATLARSFGAPQMWAHDYAQIAFVYVVFLSLAPALQSGQHVTVELFEGLVPRGFRKYLDHVAAIACILFGAIFFWYLWQLTARSFGDNRLANAVITVQLKWIQVIGPIGVLQFVLTALLRLAEAQQRLRAADRLKD